MKKSKVRPVLAIAGILLLLFAAVSVSTVASEIATVESATATRILPAEPVSAGDFFTIEIEASGYGIMGQVQETLPAGFVYVTSTLDPGSVEMDVENNTVKFTLFGKTSFNYTVAASDTAGTYNFSGILKDMNKNEYEVGGDKEIVVEEKEETAIATRTLPAELVSADTNFTVGIEASGYGIMGQVLETLPAGFAYVNSTLDPGSVEVVGNTVKFYLLGDTSFIYTVTASNIPGTYTFSGVLKDMDMNEYEVGGDKEIVVEEKEGAATATRTLPAEPVSPGTNFIVEIEAADYGTFGQVLETLPAGFAYVNSTLDPCSVEVVGNTVKFYLLGDTSFSYTATASTIKGTYNFSGILKDMDMNEYEVGGDKEIVVEEKEGAATATRTLPAEPVSPGTNFIVEIEAADYGTFGQVLETLPAGFAYVNSTLDPGSVEVAGNTVKFTLFGETSFNYTVAASTTLGIYTVSGILKDMDMNEYEVDGDKEIVVEEKEETTATRMLPAKPVSPGTNFTVGIEAAGYGTFGQVVETLPAGFVYVNSTLDSESVEVKNNTVKFTLFGETYFNYTAAASNSTGTYNFTGVLKDMNMNEYEVGGDTEIMIEQT